MTESTSIDDPAYWTMMGERRRLLFTLVPTVIGYYFATIICVNFTSLLDRYAVGSITWAYVVTLSQFVVAVVLTIVYRRRIEVIEGKFAAGVVAYEQRGGAR